MGRKQFAVLMFFAKASVGTCAALPARRKRAGPSSTVFIALQRGFVFRYEWSSPTATIAFYANGSLEKGSLFRAREQP
jgi:hypothetical protein